MAPTNKILALLAMSTMLPAAAVAQGRNWNPSLDSLNQPVVQRTDYAFDLDASGSGLSDRELHRLRQWFASLRLGYGDEINVDTGAYDNAGARQDIAALAGDYGLLLGQSAPITAGSVQPGSIRVVVSRAEAFVPGCPNWQDAYEVGNRMTTGSNYGCATNSNLASMVANPNDLVLGQNGERGGDALTATKAVDAYRRRIPTGYSGEVKGESSGGKK